MNNVGMRPEGWVVEEGPVGASVAERWAGGTTSTAALPTLTQTGFLAALSRCYFITESLFLFLKKNKQERKNNPSSLPHPPEEGWSVFLTLIEFSSPHGLYGTLTLSLLTCHS